MLHKLVSKRSGAAAACLRTTRRPPPRSWPSCLPSVPAPSASSSRPPYAAPASTSSTSTRYGTRSRSAGS